MMSIKTVINSFHFLKQVRKHLLARLFILQATTRHEKHHGFVSAIFQKRIVSCFKCVPDVCDVFVHGQISYINVIQCDLVSRNLQCNP